jgi:hypothetical protein
MAQAVEGYVTHEHACAKRPQRGEGGVPVCATQLYRRYTGDPEQ